MAHKKILNAYLHNGRSYAHHLPPSQQERYWFFKEIKNLETLPLHRRSHLLTCGGAVFAGDITQLGLGKVIVITYKNPRTKKNELRVGVLADTGAAFTQNAAQLDFFAGIFDDKKGFENILRNFPDMVNAYLLIKKSDV